MAVFLPKEGLSPRPSTGVGVSGVLRTSCPVPPAGARPALGPGPPSRPSRWLRGKCCWGLCSGLWKNRRKDCPEVSDIVSSNPRPGQEPGNPGPPTPALAPILGGVGQRTFSPTAGTRPHDELTCGAHTCRNPIPHTEPQRTRRPVLGKRGRADGPGRAPGGLSSRAASTAFVKQSFSPRLLLWALLGAGTENMSSLGTLTFTGCSKF